jgi:hypothetical protein
MMKRLNGFVVVVSLAVVGWVMISVVHAQTRDGARRAEQMETGAKASPVFPPPICFRDDLSEVIQRICDRLQFAGEPHYNVVKLAPNGAIRSIHLIVTETGEEVLTSYPYGTAFAASDERDFDVRMKVEELEGFLTVWSTLDATPGSLRAADDATPSPIGVASGLPIGWNNSVGVAPGQCLNYTIATPSNNVEQASFSSQNTASSTAEQIKVSATVSGAYGAFKASDTFSYSDNFQSSTNASNQYYNLFSLYTLNTTVSGDDPLNSQGQNAGSSFSTLCGTEYMSSVPVGMVATISINYGSSSQTTQTEISNSFKASVGLNSVSTAVSTSTKDTNATSYFKFSMIHYGGGTQAAAALNNAFAAENASNEAYYALCAAGNASACTQFTSNMGSGATKALNSFNSLVGDLSSATNPDLSFFETFPNGVAGANTTQLVTTAIPLTTNDVLNPYKSKLEQYVTLLNQIATLYNRTGTLNNAVSGGHFNPTSLIDLVSYLDELENVYKSDRTTLLSNLETCLAATRVNVKTACGPIINNTITNAYEWYASNGAHPNFFAQQNTLALQYTAAFASEAIPFPSVSLDVFYVDELPSFAIAGSNIAIAGEAALVSFADRTYIPELLNGSATPTDQPFVSFLVLEPGKPLSTNNVSTKVRDGANPSPFDWWSIGVFNPPSFRLRASPDYFFTTQACTPTFANPCAIDFTFAGAIDVVVHQQIQGLFD